MGVYNPHIPRVLGQEWVPIRDENLVFSPAVNVVELGHSFTLAQSRRIRDARFYLNTFPPARVEGQVLMASIYPKGREALSGPVRSVIIPCNSAGLTGTGFGSLTAAQIPGYLADSSDGSFVACEPDQSAAYKAMDLFFATNQYAPLLAGKRILGINYLHSFSWDPVESGVPNSVAPDLQVYSPSQDFGIQVGSGSNNALARYGPLVDTYGNTLVAMNPPRGRPPQALPLSVVELGEINHFWSNPAFPIGTTLYERMPWRYEELQRFEATSGGNRYRIHYEFGGTTAWAGVFYIGYAALQVFYCEEQRVAWGATGYGGTIQGAGVAYFKPYVYGTNILTMRDRTFTADPVLAAGDYTTVLSSPDIGDYAGAIATIASIPAEDNTYPTLNSLRELYDNPVHPGVQVNITQKDGKVFTKEQVHVLPQLTLHTSGGPLTEVHVYGRQAIAQVYGTITATQEILDTGLSSASYPQVRYYARRFGDTTVPLLLDSPTITGSGLSVQITPTEFDALDEIIDGWKEINLRFTTSPTMGAGTNPQWRWSASGELAGNRWEVLGATAPALSGVAGNLMNLIPSPNQLSSATYGQPSSGATINLGWIPQYAPPVTATADDQTSDAVLMFAQDMPTVTGFAVIGQSQALTGIGQDCDVDPCGIPTALLYNRVTWSATSSAIAASGFGYYELQRMDALTDWATVMKDSSPTATGFSDFEARVGILTSYRIRAVDELLFAGQWSSTITITTPAPGVSGSCLDGGHVLMFTSNEHQNGAINLAYSNAWEGQVREDYTFPEANMVQLQAMYNKDFFTAFRPTERGGETFDRTILVQAAAISPPTLADFRSLRDMAWDNVSYICVRDEEGNRWFATVLVPSGRVQHFRRLYMAQVRVIEVTDTPSPVDPSS